MAQPRRERISNNYVCRRAGVYTVRSSRRRPAVVSLESQARQKAELREDFMRRLVPVLSAASCGAALVCIALPAAAQPRGPQASAQETVVAAACAALAAPGQLKDMK